MRNGTNDIVGILDETGTLVTTYKYDGWGNVEVVNHTSDTTNLGINKDYNSWNLYIYCSNNPIFGIDSEGNFWLGTAIGVATYLVSTVALGQNFSFEDAVVAGFLGRMAAFGLGWAISSAFITGLYTTCTYYDNGVDISKAIIAGLLTTGLSLICIENLVNAKLLDVPLDDGVKIADTIFAFSNSVFFHRQFLKQLH